ncbi:MAG: nuclear transport factor 2 family protein [Pseudonocardiales bacterium]
MSDEQQIRDLIERWAAAVHTGDLPTVLADHAPDIVMFDVPPPEHGVRGLAAYRETWPGFFQWQAAGAMFEIDSLEVTAGTDVAFAFALLRCGTAAEFDRNPEHRLRLTIGLSKVDNRWVVTHEHHSFVDASGSVDASAAEIRSVHERWFDRTAAKDLDGLMEHIAPDVVSYEHAGPLQYIGIDEVREVCRRGLESTPGRIEFDNPDLHQHLSVPASDDLAHQAGRSSLRSEGSDCRWTCRRGSQGVAVQCCREGLPPRRRSAFRAWSLRALGIVWLDELGHGRALDPVGVFSARPAVLADERAVNGGVHEHQGGGYGALGGESRSQATGRGEASHDELRAPEPVTFGHRVHIGGFRVGVRSHGEYVGQGRRPLLQFGDELCPTGHERAGIGQVFHLRDDLPPGHRHRFVVTHQRPVQRELQKCRLATDRGKHRLAAHPGSGGHGVDGRA